MTAMKRTLYSALICCLALNAAYAMKGGRYDPQILAATSRVLASETYRNVHAEVEDGIVTLHGTVKLESLRAGLEYKIRHLANVAGVHNEVLLDPPPVEDKVLFGRVSNKLRDAGFENIRVRTHNGAVTLVGIARTQRERSLILQATWATDGVREVFSQLSLAY
jgi:osmotically-inducible protein OsmY